MAVVFAVLPPCRRPDPSSSSSTQRCVDTTRPDIVHLNNQNDPSKHRSASTLLGWKPNPDPLGLEYLHKCRR